MPPALRIHSLWKCYAAGVRGCSARVWVLRGVSFAIETGECVAIVGAPGSGKTTLGECILGLRTPTAGRIEIAAAVEIVDLHGIGRSREQAPVPAASAVLPRTVLVFARSLGAVSGWSDRVLMLRDGALRPVALQAVRRVAEGPTVAHGEMALLR